MKAGEALATGFRHTHRAWPIIGLGFVIGLGITLMEKLSEGGTPVGRAATVLSALMFFLMAVLFAALWVLWSGGLLGWTRDRLSGTPTTWTRFYETGSRLFWRLCLLLILESAMIIGAFLMGVLGCAILFRLSPIAGILGIALALPATFLLMFLVTYSGVSLVEHDLGPVASIKDSMRFTWGHFWATGWLVSLISLVWIGLYAVVAVPIGGFLIFKLGLKEALQLFSAGKALPLPLELALQAAGAYSRVLCNVAFYAYYLGNQPASVQPMSAEPTIGPGTTEESS